MGLCRVHTKGKWQNGPLLCAWTLHMTKTCTGVFGGRGNGGADLALFLCHVSVTVTRQSPAVVTVPSKSARGIRVLGIAVRVCNAVCLIRSLPCAFPWFCHVPCLCRVLCLDFAVFRIFVVRMDHAWYICFCRVPDLASRGVFFL
jgi:hypothetical protein